MSHSITTAASYLLNKYSRSYPPAASPVRALGHAESEWQHFTNPVMRVILEAKKSPSGKLVSMRLKTLWSLHTEPDDPHIDQREVVFEDLELLSFSSLPTFHMTGVQPDQSLPLKAVYRDAVVGIRYLHPRIVPPSSQPTYRRFQVTFKDAQDASQFIDAIKSVCPCKANPHPTHLNQHPTLPSTSLMRTATAMPGPMATPMRPGRLIESDSVDLGRIPSMVRHPPDNCSFSIAPSAAASLSSDDTFVTCSETSYRADTRVDTSQSSLPNSSQPSSSDKSANMPPPLVPRRATREPTAQEPSRAVSARDGRSQMLASLSEYPSLYEMSRTELEVLVGQVIREEGFLQLLETLDSMWQLKGLLGR